MKIEKIFRGIPGLEGIVLDMILFESKYPIMFTCKNGNDIFLFLCCLVNSNKAEWIGTKTTYENLIGLLENDITIRDAFLNVAEEKIIIEYNGQNVDYKIVQSNDIQEDLLPAAGEYMDAEEYEYAEEIAAFKTRNLNVEYVIKPCISNLWIFNYIGKSVVLTDDYYNADLASIYENKYNIGEIREHRMDFV